MSKRILLIGAFGYHNNQLDGQTVKSRSIYRLLTEKSKDKIEVYETQKLYKNAITQFLKLVWVISRNDLLVVLPASRSLTYIVPFVFFLAFVLRKKMGIICIGGFQIEYFNGEGRYKRKHRLQKEVCKRVHAFLPELRRVEETLIKEDNFTNVHYFPNFRFFDFKSDVSRKSENEKKIKIVFMARINRKKGYDLLINFAKFSSVNGMKVIIDFYGQIAEDDRVDFLRKIKQFDFVSYRGVLKPEEIDGVLSSYDILVLPTRYYNEGVPGSVVDAYIAGIPVVVTNWRNAQEVVENGKTGIIVDFDEPQKPLNQALKKIYESPDALFLMKQAARRKSMEYTADSAWGILRAVFKI